MTNRNANVKNVCVHANRVARNTQMHCATRIVEKVCIKGGASRKLEVVLFLSVFIRIVLFDFQHLDSDINVAPIE